MTTNYFACQRMLHRRYHGCPAMGMTLACIAYARELARLLDAKLIDHPEYGRRITSNLLLHFLPKHPTITQ